ncbi:ABC transporter ATP-binding protein [Thomasclavelia saccharogumia]|uniref:ABC transporter ATP-binding protein n=1 Tax=Thomasclavelia saccharogumia TaxID=341225 RepID=UPI00047BA06E|nr:ABC transporter ATP-binding protein [Thomasclavelia saccharogumia]
MAVLKKLFAYAGKYKYLTILSIIFSVISAVMLLMPFIWIWKVIDVILDVYPNYGQGEAAIQYGYYALICAVIGILLYVAGLLCSHLAAFRIASNMRKAALHHVVLLPLGYFSKEGSGKLRKIIDEAAASTETYLAHQLPDMAQLITTVCAVIICLFIFDWKFAVASLIPTLLALSNMFKMVGPDLQDSMKAYMDALEGMSNEAVEYIRGIPVVKTFQQTVFSFDRFHQAIKNYEKFAIGYTNKMRIPMTLFTTFINSIFIFIIGAMILLILNGFNLGKLMPDFLFYVIFTPIIAVTTNKIMFASENTMLAQDGVNRIEGIINEKPFSYSKSTNKIINNDIEFEHVSFSYPGSSNEVLHDINLKIKSGTTVAFVGKSGGGKSTLVSLIPRFYDVTKGKIKIGGINVKDLSEEELMNKISFVFQDCRLLKKSFRDNIKMGLQVSEDKIIEAVDKAQCSEIIKKFDLGLETKIGSRGVYLSGGETQRLTLARAIAKNAPILLLDEATAYADSDNEILMQKAIMELTNNKTTIMIAHRLSTIVNVDCIYVVDDGSIVESGNHEQLVKENGLYAKMWKQYCQSVDWKVGEAS